MTDFFDRPGDTSLARFPLEAIAATVAPTTNDEVSIATIKRLSLAISARSADYARYDSYYKGDHGMRFASSDHKNAFATTFGPYAENFCGTVVDAIEERLDVEGFRVPPPGEEPTAPVSTDPDAWRIWQDNQLDAGSQIAHTEALIKSVVYVLVSPFESERVGGRSPKITIEDAFEAYVECAPGTRDRIVGIKRWSDLEEKRTYATLYFRDRIEKWQTGLRAWGNQYGSGTVAEPERWERRLVTGEAWPLPHSLGAVPLVPLVNRPRLNGEGRSELADIIPIQDAINKLASDELVTSDTASFPQKWATGVEVPKDPVTGKDVEGWRPAVDRFMSTPAPDAKFGQFPAAELKGYIDSITQKVEAIIAISGLPFHYFSQHSGQPPSGESIRSSETRLVRKAKRKARHFGEGWEEVIRLAFMAMDDARGLVLDGEAKWANPETLTEAEHTDSLIKRRTGLKVPLKQLWEDDGYTPAQIASFPAMLAEEASWLDGTFVAPVSPDGAEESIQEHVNP